MTDTTPLDTDAIAEILGDYRTDRLSDDFGRKNMARLAFADRLALAAESLLAEVKRQAGLLDRVRKAVDGPHPADSGLDSFTLAHISVELDDEAPQ